jgi:hypothetical protein
MWNLRTAEWDELSSEERRRQTAFVCAYRVSMAALICAIFFIRS